MPHILIIYSIIAAIGTITVSWVLKHLGLLMMKPLYVDKNKFTDGSLVISTYSKKQETSKDMRSSLWHFLIALLLFPLCAYLLIFFQGKYFISIK